MFRSISLIQLNTIASLTIVKFQVSPPLCSHHMVYHFKLDFPHYP